MAWYLSAFADEASPEMDKQIEALRRAGLSWVDLRSVDGINIAELPLDHAEQVKAKLDAAGILVGMFGSPIGKIDIADDFDIDRKRMEHLGKLRQIFDAKAVRLFSYYNRDGAELAVWRKETVDRLLRLMELADKHDLVLYHENEREIFGDKVSEVAVLRDELHEQNPARFKLIFDFDNFARTGVDLWDIWKELRDTTEAFHLKDSRKVGEDEYQHVPAGEGDGQIERILRDAAERGWNGPLTLEPHLVHSAAVMATGPSGRTNESFADMSTEDCFHVAAETAKTLIDRVRPGR